MQTIMETLQCRVLENGIKKDTVKQTIVFRNIEKYDPSFLIVKKLTVHVDCVRICLENNPLDEYPKNGHQLRK